MVPMFKARRRRRASVLAVVLSVAAVLASAPAVPASAQTSPTSTTTTMKSGSAPAAVSTSPTTTVPPWDAAPKEKSEPGSAPTPPVSPTAKPAPASAPTGFDPGKSVLIEAETTPTKAVYENADGTKTAKIST